MEYKIHYPDPYRCDPFRDWVEYRFVNESNIPVTVQITAYIVLDRTRINGFSTWVFTPLKAMIGISAH